MAGLYYTWKALCPWSRPHWTEGVLCVASGVLKLTHLNTLVFAGGHGIWKYYWMSVGNAPVWQEASQLFVLAACPTGPAKENAAELLRGLQLRGEMLCPHAQLPDRLSIALVGLLNNHISHPWEESEVGHLWRETWLCGLHRFKKQTSTVQSDIWIWICRGCHWSIA